MIFVCSAKVASKENKLISMLRALRKIAHCSTDILFIFAYHVSVSCCIVSLIDQHNRFPEALVKLFNQLSWFLVTNKYTLNICSFT